MKRRWVKRTVWILSGIVLLVGFGWWRFIGGPKLLFAAVRAGRGGDNPARVKTLLLLGVSPTQFGTEQGDTETTPLIEAIVLNNYGAVLALLDAGVSPRSTTRYGRPALHDTLYNRDERILKLMLERGADPNQKDRDGGTPLHDPFEEVEQFMGLEDMQLVPKYALLIKAGGRLDLRDKDGRTPLYLATEYGLPQVYDLMVASGADPKEKTPDGATLLHAAASGRWVFEDKGKITLLKKLAPLLGTINTPDNEGYTPLDYATRGRKYKEGMGQDDTIAALKQLGARPGKTGTPGGRSAEGH